MKQDPLWKNKGSRAGGGGPSFTQQREPGPTKEAPSGHSMVSQMKLQTAWFESGPSVAMQWRELERRDLKAMEGSRLSTTDSISASLA